MANSFTDIIAWQRAHVFAVEIYKVTDSFPGSESYNLTPQIRRAAVSIVSNIAEGYERGSTKELARFFLIARGSNAELQTQLLLAKDLGYISKSIFSNLAAKSIEVNKLLNAFRKGAAR